MGYTLTLYFSFCLFLQTMTNSSSNRANSRFKLMLCCYSFFYVWLILRYGAFNPLLQVFPYCKHSTSESYKYITSGNIVSYCNSVELHHLRIFIRVYNNKSCFNKLLPNLEWILTRSNTILHVLCKLCLDKYKKCYLISD